MIAKVYDMYQRRLRSANAFDFDDLIGETVALLQRHPNVAQYYRRRFRHILVDEYQDTNHAQYVLIRELTGDDENADPPPAELCVVGDADQSIYAFRGATIRNIEEFERDFRTRRPSCSSRTTAPPRPSCRRRTRSSRRTRTGVPSGCGPTRATAS